MKQKYLMWLQVSHPGNENLSFQFHFQFSSTTCKHLFKKNVVKYSKNSFSKMALDNENKIATVSTIVFNEQI